MQPIYGITLTHALLPDMTPYQKWSGKRPDITYIQEFGHDTWVLDEQINPSKLEPNAHKYKFVRYEEGPRAIKYYDAQKKTLKVSCNFRFPQSIVNPNAASRSRFEGEMRDNKNQSESSSLNKLPPDTAQEEASTNNKRKTTDGDNDSKSTCHQLNDETHCPNEEIPKLDDDPDEDEHETSSAAHVYKAFSDSTLEKDPKTLLLFSRDLSSWGILVRKHAPTSALHIFSTHTWNSPEKVPIDLDDPGEHSTG
jgi:hypothetical protein